ncbi:NUDIX domain-containing protein [Sporosarcina cyprini]|uniref:NUDIX domain-containing protein n=1 Tax=Sporosarcina cyprini TaxID=2910523 RepID=UPI001EDDC776|nr:NUDIX hydrolase [Sporosarcina cyprini]MCG3088863.1 NUDIX hydrolase [Sporosarcina cyprini]
MGEKMITKNHGYEWVEFIPLTEKEIMRYHPIAGSFAIVECAGKYLMCYNTWREQWEIPAGQREAHETARDCAIRELYEETGQRVTEMQFKGLMKVKNLATETLKYNPVYFTSINQLQPFQKNAETSKIILWDGEEDIGYVDEVDLKLLNWFGRE